MKSLADRLAGVEEVLLGWAPVEAGMPGVGTLSWSAGAGVGAADTRWAVPLHCFLESGGIVTTVIGSVDTLCRHTGRTNHNRV